MIFSSNYNGHHARDLASGFCLNGVEIAFISLSNPIIPPWIDQIHKKDFSNEFKKKQSLFRKIHTTISLCRRYKPDLIQTHLFIGGIVGLVAGKFLRIPVIHTRHHIDEHYQSGTFVHRWIDRTVAKKAEHVVVCSAAAKKWLVEVEGVEDSHISIINQGFDFDFLNPSQEAIDQARKNLNFSPDNINIICVARYSRVKGQDFLLLALKELINEIPNITLTFMGPGDSSWLFDMVNELELSNSVRILSSRDDVPACIAASDIIVHPSLADSFSQLVIEAQACGGLLIASDIAAVREQIIDGVTGFIVPPRDSTSIENAIRYVIKNPKICEKIKRRAFLHVREKFTWQRMIQEEIDTIYKVLEKY